MTEKRLLIDIAGLREAYSKGDLSNLGWIRSEYNIADALTKEKKESALHRILLPLPSHALGGLDCRRRHPTAQTLTGVRRWGCFGTHLEIEDRIEEVNPHFIETHAGRILDVVTAVLIQEGTCACYRTLA